VPGKNENETKVGAVKVFELIYWKRKLVTQAEIKKTNGSNKRLEIAAPRCCVLCCAWCIVKRVQKQLEMFL